MQLLSPLSLIALLPLAGAIILLYLLRLRRRDLVIPSVFLWRRAVQDIQANAPFQKLRRSLLLLLQLAALAAIVAALAAPFFLAARLAGASTIIVLDASASMKAADAPGSRFEEAKRRAQDIIKGMGRRDEIALIVCTDRAHVALPFSRDQRRLFSSLNDTEPTDCLTNVRDGILLAVSLASKRPKSTIYLISDGAFPALPEVSTPADIRFLRVGARSDNLAILAFEALRPAAAPRHQVFLRLHNYSPQPKRALLTLYHEDQLLSTEPLDLPPGQDITRTYQLALTQPGLLKAELDAPDDLAADNIAFAFAEPPSAATVLLITPGNLFLEQALLVLPDIEAHKVPSLAPDDADDAYRRYNVLIFDRSPIPKPPASGAFLIIGDSPGDPAAARGPQLDAPAITRWEERHPVLRYVNLGAIQIAKARALAPAPGSLTIARAADHPIVVAYDRPGLRLLSFGWNFLDSDLPLRVGFPVLLSNSLQWLSQTTGLGPAMRIRPGAPVHLPAPPGAGRAELLLPDGRRRTIASQDGRFAITETHQVGAYQLTAGDGSWQWAADLRSSEESDLTPAQDLKLGPKAIPADLRPPKSEQHLWPLLALLSLALLLGEWHLYHRRY